MKKYALSVLAGGIVCSAGFAGAASGNALSDYAAPPVSSMIKNNEFMVGAEWLSLSSEGRDQNKDAESMTGYRLQYARNFGVESTGFWSASISWGQAWGSGDQYDLQTNSLRFGIDRNFKVGTEGLYAFVGARVGMSQSIIRLDQGYTVNGRNLHLYDNASELGIGAGVKYYFPQSAGSLTAGVLYMWRNGNAGLMNNSGMSVTTIYAGYSFAF
ncbi:hypothetical protein [uncultured Akkermansia sp.]|nr:hypothetical protein [uncultured Akkermansia sp.]